MKKLLIAAALLSTPALAAPVVTAPEVRAPMAGQTVTAAYFTVSNPDVKGDVLQSVTTPAAGRVELHSIMKHGDRVHMMPVKTIMVAGKSTVTLAPGGMHVMLFDVKAPLKPGDTVPLTLKFKRAGNVMINAAVVARPGMAAHAH